MASSADEEQRQSPVRWQPLARIVRHQVYGPLHFRRAECVELDANLGVVAGDKTNA